MPSDNELTRTSVAFLALAGLISAGLTLFVLLMPVVNFIGVGFVFGSALTAYFIWYEQQRSFLKLALLTCVCTLAWPAANLCAFGASVIAHAFSSAEPQTLTPLPVFFVGGFAGALLILSAGTILFGHRSMDGRAVGTLLLYSVGCGILGVIGAWGDGLRTHGAYQTMRYLPLIWQPGTALLLALLIRKDRAPWIVETTVLPVADEAVSQAENPRLVAGVFLTLLAGLIGFWVFRIVQAEREGTRMQVAQRRYEAEAPPPADLSPVEPIPLEQALILEQIDGLYPWQALALPPGRSERQYSVGYSAVKDPPPAKFVQRIVRVDVTLLPSESVAKYRTKNPRYNVAVISPASLTNVQRFGQTVIQDTYGNVCFHWPSNNIVVSVCFDTSQIHDAFLRRYLEKYPSSLVHDPAR